ncbi:MAG: tetratricopeptide repeat protein [Pirellulales bacterium]|nr:tetratricopeptide repeat protein [Pirellulales bacterium]
MVVTAVERSEQPAAATTPGETIAPWQAMLVLVALTLAVFHHVGSHGFVFDDLINIQSNDQLNWAGLGRFWREPYASMYIPVTYSFWVAEAEAARTLRPTASNLQLDPGLFHFANLALHVAVAVLVFVWLRTLRLNSLAAVAGALLFAVHPLQTETVNWVTETKGTLAALFGCGALLVFGQSLAAKPAKRWPLFGAATLLLALALLSKPSAAAIPLIALAVEWGFQQRPLRRLALPLAIWAALVVLVAWWAASEQEASALRNLAAPAWRPLVAADAVSFYLQKLVSPFAYCLDYGRTPAWLVKQPAIYFTWVLPVALAAVLAALPRQRTWLTALAVFVAGLAPTLGLIPFAFQEISTVADRYAYLAMLGPALAVAAILTYYDRRPVLFGVFGLLLVFGFIANRASEHWQNQATVFNRALAVNPRSVMGNLAIGNLLVSVGKFDEGLAHFRRGLESDPQHPGLIGNLGIALEGAGQYEEASEVLHKALKLRPDNHLAHIGLGRIYQRAGDQAHAIESFERAIELNDSVPEAHVFLAQALADSGATGPAIEQFERALQMHPQWMPAAAELMWLWSTSNDAKLRNGPAAVKLGESIRAGLETKSAAPQDRPDALFFDALAASYAETNQYMLAVQVGSKLVEELQLLAAKDAAWNDYLAGVSERLNLYHHGQPVRNVPPGHRLKIPGR